MTSCLQLHKQVRVARALSVYDWALMRAYTVNCYLAYDMITACCAMVLAPPPLLSYRARPLKHFTIPCMDLHLCVQQLCASS